MSILLSTARRELELSLKDSHFSDFWSDATGRVYFDAAGFHGLEVVHENVPDIYSYAFEALDALERLGPEVHIPDEMVEACRDWHSGRMSRSRFLERINTHCEEEEAERGSEAP